MTHNIFFYEKKQKISEAILKQIKELIRNNTYPPGTRLPSEKTFANMFEVSRVPVREALNALAAVGIVVTIQGGGTWVKEIDVSNLLEKASIEMISINQVQELLDFRIIIETKAAAMAARLRTSNDLEIIKYALDEINKDMVLDSNNAGDIADYNFHNAIVKSSYNYFLIHSVENISDLYLKLLKFSLKYNIGFQEKRKDIFSEHCFIYQAIKKRDSEAASFYMKQHLKKVKEKLYFLEN